MQRAALAALLIRGVTRPEHDALSAAAFFLLAK
jgi:hypothetical protein